jgi:ABC-type multidrug transport system fused ATPase/permease subunit
VILDEPTAALDAKAEHELFTRIGELFADRSELLAAAGTYAELFTLQAPPYQ